MLAVNCLRIIILGLFCAYVSYTDLKIGQIQNKAVITAMSAGVILTIIDYCTANELFVLADYCVNMLALTGFSVFLYLTHAWAGGDVKMVIAVGLLYPPQMYWDYNGNKHTLVIFLLFAFCIGFLYVLTESLFRFFKDGSFTSKTIQEIVKILMDLIKSYICSLIFIYAYGQIYYVILSRYVHLNDIGYLLSCLMLIYIISRISIFREKAVIIAFIIFDIFMTYISGYFGLSKEWKNYLLVLLFMVLRILIEQYNYQVISVDELRPGMVLSRLSSFMFMTSAVIGLPGISDETLKSRLTPAEIDSIQRWKKSKKGKESLVIVRKIPFAIFISLGLLNYILIGKLLKWY